MVGEAENLQVEPYEDLQVEDSSMIDLVSTNSSSSCSYCIHQYLDVRIAVTTQITLTAQITVTVGIMATAQRLTVAIFLVLITMILSLPNLMTWQMMP